MSDIKKGATLSGVQPLRFFAALGVVVTWIVFVAALVIAGDRPLIESLKTGHQSPELFELPNGVNEFDLLRVNGVYYLASDNKKETELRSAKTIAGLAKARAFVPVPNGAYPSIQYRHGVWHLWVYFGHRAITQHFTSSKFEGPYDAADTLPLGLADIHVRRSRRGVYYAVYKDVREGAKLAAGLLTSQSLYGPWKDMGHIFFHARATWHAGEEADPALFEYNGKTYLTFAGWDGLDGSNNQKLGIVEVSPQSGKAVGEATILLGATKPWHVRNGQSKLFNPVFLCDGGRSRLFFAQNVSAPGVPAGWGYIEAENECRK